MSRLSQRELERLWAARDPSLAVAYRFGEEVLIKAGDEAGKHGRVVALISMEPHTTYVIELPPGDNAMAFESDIERV